MKKIILTFVIGVAVGMAGFFGANSLMHPKEEFEKFVSIHDTVQVTTKDGLPVNVEVMGNGSGYKSAMLEKLKMSAKNVTSNMSIVDLYGKPQEVQGRFEINAESESGEFVITSIYVDNPPNWYSYLTSYGIKGIYNGWDHMTYAIGDK